MRTDSAPVEEIDDDQLLRDIEFASSNPIIDGLMNVVSGLLAVLNEKRQVLALNGKLLEAIGIDDPSQALGLRPGDVLGCGHAHRSETGCGTTEYCGTCGAAIAIATSLTDNQPVEQPCAITAVRAGREVDLYLNVRACPVRFDDRRLLLLFMQDMTREQEWAALERVFYHDVRNIISGLVGASQLLPKVDEDEARMLADRISGMSTRLAQEVDLQRCLSRTGVGAYRPMRYAVSAGRVLNELRDTFANHDAAAGRTLRFDEPTAGLALETDFPLLVRILSNMVTNALEATEEGGEVRIWCEGGDEAIRFCVWNAQAIPDDVARRVFQRNFTTKEGTGRGLGTYSMRLFGEQFLGGEVDFDSSEPQGTVFHIDLPIRRPVAEEAPA